MSDGFGHSPTPPPVPAALPVIDYDTPPPNRTARRVFLIAALALVSLGLVLIGALFSVRSAVAVAPPPIRLAPKPPPLSQPQIQAMVQQSMTDSNKRRLDDLLTDSLAPATVVYEEDPVQARQLHGNGVCDAQASRSGMSQPFFSAFEPPVYRRPGFWQGQQAGEREDALLFAHQLTSKSGNGRLVLLLMEVKLEPSVRPGNECDVKLTRQLKYQICEPKLSGTYPDIVRDGASLTIVQDGDHAIIPIRWIDGSLRPNRDPAYNLRFFAGQADPNDPSHFRLDYDLGGVKNSIDGYLTDDDFLRIIPRAGKVDQGKWLIDKP
jgi:hypothetical protein